MSADLPPLIHVDLEEVEGVKRHSFPLLVAHLESQMDASLRSNILFFYLTGSRLYGTATEDSDWDYVCVTKTATREARKSEACLRNGDDSAVASKPFMLTESNVYDMDATLELYGLPKSNVPVGLRFDVSFYELAVFNRLAQEQAILPLEAQCLPSPFILYKVPDFPIFNIDPPVLKTTASLLGGLKFANARPRITEGNYIKGKKLGALGIRYVQFGIQLLESYRDIHNSREASKLGLENGATTKDDSSSDVQRPKITDWHSIRPIWHDLFEKNDPKTYDEFETVFRPTFKSFDTYIRQIMVFPTLYTIREKFLLYWIAIKSPFPKLDKFPKVSSLNTLTDSWSYSNSAIAWLSNYLQIDIPEDGTQLDSIKKMANQFHIFPSTANGSSLISFSLTCHSPIYEHPYLAELSGMIIDSNTGNILSCSRFSTPLDLVVLKPFLVDDVRGWKEVEGYAQLVALLEEEALEVNEIYDGFKVALLYCNDTWQVLTVGGAVDASEKISLRTTEGRGPPKTTVKDQFLKMLAEARSMALKDVFLGLDPNRIYVFDMLTNCSRFITAHNPERLVFQCSLPSCEGIPTKLGRVSSVKHFSEISKELNRLQGWKPKLNYLLQNVELMNPFEQAGYEIQSPKSGKIAKLYARSYWSVRASIGHQNRVLAFNLSADHFEMESLLDVCIYGYSREFTSTFPQWKDTIAEKVANELNQLCDWLEAQKSIYLTTQDRKQFALSIKNVSAPLRAILFEWYNYPFVSPLDIVSSLDLGTLRQLREQKDAKR